MECFRNVQSVAVEKLGAQQKACDAKGYGHLGLGAAGAVMFFVFCPMSIVAVAAPYWKFSSEAQGISMSATASLWDISVSSEVQGQTSETSVGMCGDEMQDFDECGKIGAIRFFVITALLMSLAAAITMMAGFLPLLRPSAALQRKISMGGLILASLVLLWAFLAACIAGSIEMKDGYKLSGAGFVFLVLELFFVMASMGLVMYTLKSSTLQVATDADKEGKAQQQQPRVAQDLPPTVAVPPTLLVASGLSHKEDLEKGEKTDNVNTNEIRRDRVPEEDVNTIEIRQDIVSEEACGAGDSKLSKGLQQVSSEPKIEVNSPRDHKHCACPGM